MTDHEHDEVPTATFVDAEDTKDYEPEHEQVVEAEHAEQSEKAGNENLGENIVKAATEAAYAAVGFVGFVGEKAKSFYEEQQRQYVATHPDTEATEGSKAFLAQMREQMNKLVEELTKGYKDMVERGRDSRHDAPASPVEEPGQPAS